MYLQFLKHTSVSYLVHLHVSAILTELFLTSKYPYSLWLFFSP